MPLCSHKDFHEEDVNWLPRSEMIVEGKPKMEIQLSSKAFHTDSVVISEIGTAIGYLVVRSITVSMYLQPLDSRRGPTRSTWMVLNLLTGIGIFSTSGC